MPKQIQTLIRICLFKSNPQDLADSRELLIGSIAASFVVLLVGYSLLPTETSAAVLAASHVLFIGVSWMILLQITGKAARWTQSASAMYGTSACLNLVSMPLIATNDRLLSAEPVTTPDLTMFAFVSVWIWEIVVSACIIRETIETRMRRGVFISLLMTFAMQFIMVTLFSPTT